MSEPDELKEQDRKLEERKLKLEEYKLWVEDLSRISAQRGNRTAVYVTINSITLTGIALFLRDFDADRTQSWLLMSLFPFLTVGVVACLAWRQTVISYQRLVGLRINALREIEKQPEIKLSVKAFHAEDELLPRDEFGQAEPRGDYNFSNLELQLPIVLLATYIIFYIGLSVLVIGA